MAGGGGSIGAAGASILLGIVPSTLLGTGAVGAGTTAAGREILVDAQPGSKRTAPRRRATMQRTMAMMRMGRGTK